MSIFTDKRRKLKARKPRKKKKEEVRAANCLLCKCTYDLNRKSDYPPIQIFDNHKKDNQGENRICHTCYLSINREIEEIEFDAHQDLFAVDRDF